MAPNVKNGNISEGNVSQHDTKNKVLRHEFIKNIISTIPTNML